MQHRIRSPRDLAVIICLLTTLAFSPLLAQTKTDTSIAGSWQGTLEFGNTKLRIVFHVTESDSNRISGEMDSPDQGATGIPVSKITVIGNSIVFDIASMGGLFEGKLSDGKQSIEGNWKQNGVVLPLRLNKTTVAIVLKRPQEPKPPFPYRVEDVSYENTKNSMKLAGTLTLPDANERFPAVILITGSGPHDRDESVFGHKPFLVLADYLTRRGIAVLRVDDRGVGGSTGNKMAVTSADHAEDVIAEIEFLKRRRDIDPSKIGLIGHSEGGMIAPMAASQSKDVAFIVMLAGPGLPGEDILKMQTRLIEEADSIPPGKISQNVHRMEKICSIVKSGTDSVAIAGQIRSYLMSTVSEWGADLVKSGVDSEKAIDSQINQFDGPWFRYFTRYDPRPALEKVKCPVLAMDGTLDLQVPPKEDLAAIGKALQTSGNKDVTTKLMPGLNHLFQDAKIGSPKEYVQIEETFSPAALKVLGDWIEEHTRR
jgi:pimeloyl-ACP methyl ester carboxylesterase